MTKAFLSHSSSDKSFVRVVADVLGNGCCHYDERTFEPSMESAEAILNALATSSIFVLFLSENALNSPWVKRELDYAKHLYFSGRINKVAIFPLNGADRKTLPEWLAPFVVQTLPQPRLVALRIKSMLTPSQGNAAGRFIGRDEALGNLKNALRDHAEDGRGGVLLFGIPGIGRSRLMRRAIDDIYPELNKHWVEIKLGNYEGEVVLFERLNDYFSKHTDAKEIKNEVEDFLLKSPEDRLNCFRDILNSAQNAKQVILLQFTDDLIASSGEVSSWLLRIIKNIKSNYPVLVITASRAPSPNALARMTEIINTQVRAIAPPDARLLLELLSHDENITIPSTISDYVLDVVGGHPGLLELSVRLIKKVGFERFKIDLTHGSRKSAIEEYVENAISNAPLDLLEKSILVMLDEVGGASREDVLHAFDSDNNPDIPATKLATLLDFSLAEEYGGEIHAASHLRLVMRRWKTDPSVNEILVQARRKLIEILEQVEDLQGGSYLALHAPIAAAIRNNGDYVNPLVSRPLLAAQQLRVARRLYDERNYKEAATHAKKAFSNKIALSSDAIIEVLRLIGLVGVRLSDPTLKALCFEWLDKDSDIKAKKIVSFIRGFEKRIMGHFKEAESFLRTALKYKGDGDFHILRELAASLLELGRPSEAEHFARKALSIAPTNPYVLDVYCASLIALLEHGPNHEKEKTCEDYLEQLQVADDREGKEFSPRRIIEFASVRGDEVLLNRQLQGYKSHSQKPWYRVAQAQIAYKKGDGKGALNFINGLTTPNHAREGDEILQFSKIRKIRILSHGILGQFDDAVVEYERNTQNMSTKEKEEIKQSLIFEIAKSKVHLSPQVKSFASS